MMTDRQGIEIDYCPQCRGVWLDRGELDKIVERTASVGSPPQAAYPQQSPTYPSRPPRHEYDHPRESHGYKKKPKSFLSELFDFD
jgi:Zn-finger nucleic acid-binding protein